MKTVAALASLLSLAAAAPVSCPAPAPTTDVLSPRGALALRSASPIHFGSINASGLGIWIHKDTSTYCPGVAGFACAPDPPTLFLGPGSGGTLGLAVTVPGGQQLYVAPDGRLRYTRAHSADTGAGAATAGFGLTGDDDLTFDGSGFVACPDGTGAYAVYAGQGPAADCLGFAFRTVPGQNSTGIWQYT